MNGYRVRWRELPYRDIEAPPGTGSPYGPWSSSGVLDADALFYTISGRNHNRVCEIRVQGRNDADDSDDTTHWWGVERRLVLRATGHAVAAELVRSPSATAGDSQLAVSWSAPAGNGAAAMYYYTVRH